MRVLDIDLDFFLADCCELAPVGMRPGLFGHEPWSAEEVRHFLESRCGLSTNGKIPGRIFATHDSALEFWHYLMEKGMLTSPFHVTHIDAHSDLGIGKPGPGFVLNSVISLHTDKRVDMERYYSMRQLDEANYLLFALAFRWVASLDNVRNPKSRPDIPAFAELTSIDMEDDAIYTSFNAEVNAEANAEVTSDCEGTDCGKPERTIEHMGLPSEAVNMQGIRRGHIRLSSYVSALFEAQNGREPCIPFTVYDDYKAFFAYEPFDFVSLAISPRYSPAEADSLIDIIKSYMEII